MASLGSQEQPAVPTAPLTASAVTEVTPVSNTCALPHQTTFHKTPGVTDGGGKSESWLLAMQWWLEDDLRAEVLATLWAFPWWIKDGSVSVLLICHDHCLWSRGSRTGQKRTGFKRKLVLHLL